MTRMAALGDLLIEENRLTEVLDEEEYPCCGVRLHGRGAFIREYKLGVNLKKKFVQHVVRTGDVIYSTLFAKAGAFAVAGEDVDGSLASEKFPTFRLISDDVSLDYLRWFFRSGQLNRIAQEQATGMAAFSLSHLSKKKFLKLKVPVPGAERQSDVVRRCKLVEETSRAMGGPIAENARLAQCLLGAITDKAVRGIPSKRLGELGRYVLRPAEIDPAVNYKQITVAVNHKGLRLRRRCLGSEIQSPGQCYVSYGDVLFSRIDIRQGAIGIVDQELDGSVVTRDFPVYRLEQTTDIALRYISFMFRTPSFMAQAIQGSRGTTGRKKMKRDVFLEITLPWPSDAQQKALVEQLELAEQSVADLASSYSRQGTMLEQLRKAVIAEAFMDDAGLDRVVAPR